jgi:hypothetical protein
MSNDPGSYRRMLYQTRGWARMLGFTGMVLVGSYFAGEAFSSVSVPEDMPLFPDAKAKDGDRGSRIPLETQNFYLHQKKALTTMITQVADGKDKELWDSLMKGEVPRIEPDSKGPPRLGRY